MELVNLNVNIMDHKETMNSRAYYLRESYVCSHSFLHDFDMFFFSFFIPLDMAG